jgi:hypothetical protein
MIPAIRLRTDERGHLLGLVAIAIIPVLGLVAAFYGRNVQEMQAYRARQDEVRATNRALAAIEIGRHLIMNSSYTSGRNDRLVAASQSGAFRPAWLGPPGSFVGFDLTDGRRRTIPDPANPPPGVIPFRLLAEVDLEDDETGEPDDASESAAIYVAKLTDLWSVMEVRALHGSVVRTARVMVRERDPFTRYAIFIDNHHQGISGSPKGDIHTNRGLQIFYPGAVFEDFVSARDGFQWMIGAAPTNTSFLGGYAAPSAQIPMPDLQDIQGLRPFAAGSAYIDSTYKDVEIRFQGSQVQIRARRVANNALVTLHQGPIPPGGVIYAEGRIVVLEGDLQGRVTVATASAQGAVITGSLRYVDGDGDPAMLNPTTPASYVHNPDYEGHSALGVISLGPVTYATTVPTTLEIHGAIFSSAGHVGLPGLAFNSTGSAVTAYNASFKKDNMLVLGSTVADRRWVGSVVNASGKLLSGFRDGAIVYDRTLLHNPPPHFLEVDRPVFRAVEILETVIEP